MRIVGGRHRGRRLAAPAGQEVRPTSDRAREALFSILEHQQPIHRRSFLDLCAGTGAVGLEAHSRGARNVLLVELAPDAVRLIRRNLRALGDPPEVSLLQADAARLPGPARRYEVAFLDPPYGSGLVRPILEGLLGGWLSGDATVVVELAAREPAPSITGLRIADERRYGAARFVFLRAAHEPDA